MLQFVRPYVNKVALSSSAYSWKCDSKSLSPNGRRPEFYRVMWKNAHKLLYWRHVTRRVDSIINRLYWTRPTSKSVSLARTMTRIGLINATAVF